MATDIRCIAMAQAGYTEPMRLSGLARKRRELHLISVIPPSEAAAGDLLASAHDWFTAGFPSADDQVARAIIEDLQ